MEKMKLLTTFCLICLAVSPSMQACSSLPDDLDGVWTSTNLGTITISSSAKTLSMTTTFHSSFSISSFGCVFNSGTQYVFKMNETVPILSGTLDVYPYGCFDFRRASVYSYYFYLNSAEEITLGNLRFRPVLSGSVGTITSAADICDSTTVDLAEFNTMIKSGFESAAISAVRCPGPIQGLFQYTYTDQTGTYCESVNTATVIACSDQNYAEVFVNNTDCSAREPFYSAGGQVGCIANVYKSSTSTYYSSLYNKDASLLAQSTYQFTCVAMQKQSNGTVVLSLMPTDCVSGQSATAIPKKWTFEGAIMVLEPICSTKTDSVSESTISINPQTNTTETDSVSESTISINSQTNTTETDSVSESTISINSQTNTTETDSLSESTISINSQTSTAETDSASESTTSINSQTNTTETDSVSESTNRMWLYILLPCLGLLIIFISVSLCIYSWKKKRTSRNVVKDVEMS